MLAALKAVQAGDMTPEAALGLLVQAPFEDIGYAKIDHHRQLRNGNSEVIYGAGKTAEQIARIAERMAAAGSENILITRLDEEKAAAVAKAVTSSMAMDWPSLNANVRAAKNMPLRFSPLSSASHSEMSATTAWGSMPKMAMAGAATTHST